MIGFNDAAAFPNPTTKLEGRSQMQSLLDQARDAVNAVDVDLQGTKVGFSVTYATLDELQNVVLGQILDGSITIPKLSFDPATQVELDATNSNVTAHLENVAHVAGRIYAYKNLGGGL